MLPESFPTPLARLSYLHLRLGEGMAADMVGAWPESLIGRKLGHY